jgi:hypothetical protein
MRNSTEISVLPLSSTSESSGSVAVVLVVVVTHRLLAARSGQQPVSVCTRYAHRCRPNANIELRVTFL